MPIFPSYSNDLIVLPRNYFKSANQKVIELEKQTNNDNTLVQPTSLSSLTNTKMKTLSSDGIVPELDVEIEKCVNYLTESEHYINEWNQLHQMQYRRSDFDRSKLPPSIHPLPFDAEAHGFRFTTEQLKKPFAQSVPYHFVPSRQQLFSSGKKRESKESYYTDIFEPEELVYKTEYEHIRSIFKSEENEMKRFIQHGKEIKLAEDAELAAEHLLKPGVEVWKSRNKNTNRFVRAMDPVAEKLKISLLKALNLITNIKVIYKTKVSGSNLNRFEQTDMLKIQALIEKFLNICKNSIANMIEQKKAIIDTDLLEEAFLHVDKSPGGVINDVERRIHIASFDQFENKFITCVNEVNKLYLGDKERYSYNLGRF